MVVSWWWLMMVSSWWVDWSTNGEWVHTVVHGEPTGKTSLKPMMGLTFHGWYPPFPPGWKMANFSLVLIKKIVSWFLVLVVFFFIFLFFTWFHVQDPFFQLKPLRFRCQRVGGYDHSSAPEQRYGLIKGFLARNGWLQGIQRSWDDALEPEMVRVMGGDRWMCTPATRFYGLVHLP